MLLRMTAIQKHTKRIVNTPDKNYKQEPFYSFEAIHNVVFSSTSAGIDEISSKWTLHRRCQTRKAQKMVSIPLSDPLYHDARSRRSSS